MVTKSARLGQGWALSALLLVCGQALAQDLAGYWRAIDDRTGFAKGIVRVDKKPDGTYSGTVVKIIPRPGYTPRQTCNKCPEPFTKKPILGLNVLQGLKISTTQSNIYEGGQILDPLSGKIYSAKARMSPDGHRVSLRGYIGVSVLGRSQSWLRETDPKMLEGLPPLK